MSALLLGWFGIGFCALYPGEGVTLPGGRYGNAGLKR